MSNAELGVGIPEILIPEEKVNLRKWSVIACDQYSSAPEYWEDVERLVGGVPSTLHIILPEAFLNDPDREERIGHCKSTMKNYIEDGILVKLPRGVVYVERSVNRKVRKGVLINIDLEQYDFLPDTTPFIKATEETVLERLPARIDIRRNAILECPHAMLLIDDPGNTVIGPISRKRDSYYNLYNFDLMQDGGHISGFFVESQTDLDELVQAVAALKNEGKTLFAVGDGNHSLVTAKAVWEEVKPTLSEEERQAHPLRFALVELVNLYDPAISFLPINRIVSNIEPSRFINEMMSALKRSGYQAKLLYSRSTPRTVTNSVKLHFVTKETMGRIEILNAGDELEVGILQSALDECLKTNERAQIDYIHGEEEFAELCRQYNAIGFRAAGIEKESLFAMLDKYGVLPRKSFSIGEADEKRFYLECRLISDNIEYEEEEAAQEDFDDGPEEEDGYAQEAYEDGEEDGDGLSRRRGLFGGMRRSAKKDAGYGFEEEDGAEEHLDEDNDLIDEDAALDDEDGLFDDEPGKKTAKSRLFGIMGKKRQ